LSSSIRTDSRIGLRLSELRAEVDVNNMSLKPMRKLLIATEEL
jgi:hypothetical protein